jgi:hypothetical protein
VSTPGNEFALSRDGLFLAPLSSLEVVTAVRSTIDCARGEVGLHRSTTSISPRSRETGMQRYGRQASRRVSRQGHATKGFRRSAAGALLIAMEQTGERRGQSQAKRIFTAASHARGIGVTRVQSSRWQGIAKLPGVRRGMLRSGAAASFWSQ